MSGLAKKDHWLLPEGVGELLPEQAEYLEMLRRDLLDLFGSWGYEIVMPPLIEYLESLLVGTGKDLDLKTFKLIDQLTGRLMGVRADMTPQVARIDAHLLKRDAPTRLCYSGPVLHTRSNGFESSRAPLQVGAELYGHAGIESDVEILRLLVEMLKTAGIEKPHIGLGHVGIYRALVREAGLDQGQEEALFEILQRKARPELEEKLKQWHVCERHQAHLKALIDLNGDIGVLALAQKRLSGAGDEAKEALDNLCQIATLVTGYESDVSFYFDLAELRGYRYQTGLVFSAFVPGHGQEVARGGRYNNIGKAFGRARPATGFSADLKVLARLSQKELKTAMAILAPAENDDALDAMVAKLRSQGERVIQALAGDEFSAEALGCDRILQCCDGSWQVTTVV